MVNKSDLKQMKIVPHVSVGPIMFNLTVEDVLSMLGEPTARFFKGFSNRETFAYDDVGMHVFFDKYLLVDSLEFFEPAKLILFDIELFELSFEDLINLFKEKDASTKEDDDGFVANQTGIAVYAPEKVEDRTLKAEAILVYRDLDYYEKED